MKMELNMYAVIQSGGKQYRVMPGQRVKLEKLTANEGENILFDSVLMVANGDKISIGKPYVENAQVAGRVLKHGRGEKIRVVKMRRRKNSRRVTGHRQYFTEVQIDSISG